MGQSHKQLALLVTQLMIRLHVVTIIIFDNSYLAYGWILVIRC